MEGLGLFERPVFKVHAKFMMQGLYVLYTSADLRGTLSGAREGDVPPAAFWDNLIFSSSRNSECCNRNN